VPIRLGKTETCQRIREGLLGWAAGWALGEACARGERHDSGLPGVDTAPAPCPGLAVAIALLPQLRALSPAEITPRSLADAWPAVVSLPDGSYGFALRNLAWGLAAPVSGWFRNPCATDSAAIARSPFWAMAAPGAPGLAASLAHTDAVIDHAEDGALGAMFVAALGASAFAERDPVRLVTVAAGALPAGSELLECVSDMRRARRRSHPWVEAYQILTESLAHLPPGHAYTTAGRVALSLLYGADWTTHLTYAADCGGDTRTSLAVLGSISAICAGPGCVPDPYREWVGEEPLPVNGVLAEPQGDHSALAEGILGVAASYAEHAVGHVALVDGDSDLSQMDAVELGDTGLAHEALTRDLGEVREGEGELVLSLQYQGSPTIASGGGKTLFLCAPGLVEVDAAGSLRLDVDGGLSVGPDRPQPASSGAYLLVSARGKTVAPVTALTAHLALADGRTGSLSFPLIAEACWWACGPFDASGSEPMRVAREPERDLSGTKTYEGRDRMRLRFRKVAFADIRMDLDDLVQNAPGIAYLVTDLECPEAFEGRLLLATTGPAKAWLDGRILVREAQGASAYDMGAAQETPVRLTAGRHRLMLKAMRGETPLSVGVLLTDLAGRPSHDIHSPGWNPLEQG
jgi:hypothetical protein